MASDVLPPFDRLSPQLQGLLPNLGISEPTEAQLAALPRVLAGENLVLIAPTGMGKTEAVVLPLLDNLLRHIIEGGVEGHKGFQLLYITPLRALNRDMLRRIQEMGRVLGITVWEFSQNRHHPK